MSNVVYLNRWLDCPDEMLRRNYEYQERLTLGKREFFQNLRHQGADEYQIALCYQRFIHDNRDRLKLIKTEIEKGFTDTP